MASIDSMNALLVDELRDIYDAEKRLTKAIPKMAKKAENEELRSALEEHLQETEGQIARLEAKLAPYVEAMGPGERPAPFTVQPRLASIDELEVTRDDLIARLKRAQAEAERKHERRNEPRPLT